MRYFRILLPFIKATIDGMFWGARGFDARSIASSLESHFGMVVSWLWWAWRNLSFGNPCSKKPGSSCSKFQEISNSIKFVSRAGGGSDSLRSDRKNEKRKEKKKRKNGDLPRDLGS